MTAVAHPSVDERVARGKAAREQGLSGETRGVDAGRGSARSRSHCWRSRTSTREPDLVPVRHGRMMVSPFTFYRGAAKIMAADLKDTPTAGLEVQLCGDAHLSNFGVYASPERELLFDLNDFDETLPGPVRVRREAPGGELHDRGAQQRLHQGRRACCDPRVGDGVPGDDGRSSPRWERWTSGMRTCPRTS